MEKILTSRRLFGPCVPLLIALGCAREGGSGAARKSEARATAAAAPSAAPLGAAQQHEPESDELAVEGGGHGDRGTDQARPDAELTRVTAAELLATIRASGSKATLVNAWATWCGPCRRELPMLQALSVNVRPQGVQMLLVSVDEPKDEWKVRAYLKDHGITLRSYLVAGSLADFKQGIHPRWPGMLPASFLFGASAALVHFWGGEAFENEIAPVLEDFVAGRSIEAETRYGLAPGKVEE